MGERIARLDQTPPNGLPSAPPAAYQTTAHTAFALRYENYNDRQGFITGTAQTLNSFTLTGEYKWVQGLLSRLEYRRDWSDQAYFERGSNGLAKNQNTLTLGFVAYFSTGLR